MAWLEENETREKMRKREIGMKGKQPPLGWCEVHGPKVSDRTGT